MKKFLALLLALAMTLALAACGGNDSQNDNSAPADNTQSDAQTPGDDAQSSGEAVTIKIGGIGPITGDLAQYGTATQWGAQIAVDEINALNGPVKLEYNFQDDTGVSDTAVSAYNNLKDWGANVIYGCTTTTPCVTVASETYADRYFQLTPSASSTDVTDGKDNVFQMCFTDPGQGTAAANYLKDNGLGTKYAVIYNNGDQYSSGIADAFIAKAGELGLEIVATQTYPEDTTTDYTVQLNACKDAGADLVFLPIYYTPASLILNQAKQMDYAPTFFGADGMDGMLDMEGFDKSLAEGLLLMTPFNASGTDDRTVSFVEKYQADHGILPNQFAADGYDCMYAIYEACCQIEGVGSMSNEELCDALIAVFTGGSFSVDGLTGSGMSWLTNGEVSKDPVVVKVENGAYVTQ
ncbi:MAG: ABC transporter substrate-binding protein [Oscillospiraceae bacterium]|nr:ABC transporter substrate-binding protein [Oscillospiraceae bacterium]